MTRFNRKYLSPALYLALLAGAFTFGPEGVSWLWAPQPLVALVLLATSVVFWIVLFASGRRAT